MFNRRRGFGENENDFNGMTGYEEKTEFPVNAGAQTPAAPFSAAALPVTAVAEEYGFTPASVTGERPRVFAMRGNDKIFVYEYSDRLEYFIKLDNTMFRYSIVNK